MSKHKRSENQNQENESGGESGAESDVFSEYNDQNNEENDQTETQDSVNNPEMENRTTTNENESTRQDSQKNQNNREESVINPEVENRNEMQDRDSQKNQQDQQNTRISPEAENSKNRNGSKDKNSSQNRRDRETNNNSQSDERRSKSPRIGYKFNNNQNKRRTNNGNPGKHKQNRRSRSRDRRSDNISKSSTNHRIYQNQDRQSDYSNHNNHSRSYPDPNSRKQNRIIVPNGRYPSDAARSERSPDSRSERGHRNRNRSRSGERHSTNRSERSFNTEEDDEILDGDNLSFLPDEWNIESIKVDTEVPYTSNGSKSLSSRKDKLQTGIEVQEAPSETPECDFFGNYVFQEELKKVNGTELNKLYSWIGGNNLTAKELGTESIEKAIKSQLTSNEVDILSISTTRSTRERETTLKMRTPPYTDSEMQARCNHFRQELQNEPILKKHPFKRIEYRVTNARRRKCNAVYIMDEEMNILLFKRCLLQEKLRFKLVTFIKEGLDEFVQKNHKRLKVNEAKKERLKALSKEFESEITEDYKTPDFNFQMNSLILLVTSTFGGLNIGNNFLTRIKETLRDSDNADLFNYISMHLSRAIPYGKKSSLINYMSELLDHSAAINDTVKRGMLGVSCEQLGFQLNTDNEVTVFSRHNTMKQGFAELCLNVARYDGNHEMRTILTQDLCKKALETKTFNEIHDLWVTTLERLESNKCENVRLPKELRESVIEDQSIGEFRSYVAYGNQLKHLTKGPSNAGSPIKASLNEPLDDKEIGFKQQFEFIRSGIKPNQPQVERLSNMFKQWIKLLIKDNLNGFLMDNEGNPIMPPVITESGRSGGAIIFPNRNTVNQSEKAATYKTINQRIGQFEFWRALFGKSGKSIDKFYKKFPAAKGFITKNQCDELGINLFQNFNN